MITADCIYEAIAGFNQRIQKSNNYPDVVYELKYNDKIKVATINLSKDKKNIKIVMFVTLKLLKDKHNYVHVLNEKLLQSPKMSTGFKSINLIY